MDRARKREEPKSQKNMIEKSQKEAELANFFMVLLSDNYMYR